MAEKSTDQERRELQDEILYLSRLIDSHNDKVKGQHSETRSAPSSNRYRLVNSGKKPSSKPSSTSSSNPSRNLVYRPKHSKCASSASSSMGSPQASFQCSILCPISPKAATVKPRKKSLSATVCRSRYKLQKMHATPSAMGTAEVTLKAGMKVFHGPGATKNAALLSPRSASLASKPGTSGRYVYRKNNSSVATSSSSHFRTSPAKHMAYRSGGKSTVSKALVSTYKLVRNKTKTPTPTRSPATNLSFLGARRIVKKYKVNNMNRTRIPYCNILSQGTSVAAGGKKLFWPPSYSSTHYFHGQKSKFNRKASTDTRSGQSCYIKIGGITYRSSRNKLSRAQKTLFPQSPATYREPSNLHRVLLVRGIMYRMDTSGKTLRRMLSSTSSPGQGSPRTRIDVGGQTYVEWKPGVYSQTPSSETRTYLSRTINRSIHRVHTVHTRKMERRANQYCMFFNRFGRCNKGNSCKYIHDPDKVAVCTRFLRSTCKVSDCPFSHKVAPEKMPVCSFFLRGRCTSNPCPYRHVKVNAKAEVCRDFAIRGCCDEGLKCKKQHILICPEYAAKKNCPRGAQCFLAHRDRNAKRKRDEKESQGASASSKDALQTPKGFKKRDENVADQTAKDEGKQDPSRKIAWAPSFISLEPYESPLPTPPSKSRRTGPGTGIRIRPNFLS